MKSLRNPKNVHWHCIESRVTNQFSTVRARQFGWLDPHWLATPLVRCQMTQWSNAKVPQLEEKKWRLSIKREGKKIDFWNAKESAGKAESNLAAGDGSPDGDLYIKSKWNVRGGLDRMWNEVRTRNQKLKIHPAPCKHASIAQNDFEIHYKGCRGRREKKITGGCKPGQNWRARLQNMGETGSKRFEKAINRQNSTKQGIRADVGALAGRCMPNVHHGRSNKNILNEIKNKKMCFAG